MTPERDFRKEFEEGVDLSGDGLHMEMLPLPGLDWVTDLLLELDAPRAKLAGVCRPDHCWTPGKYAAPFCHFCGIPKPADQKEHPDGE